MNDYSKLSDFEVNRMVAKSVGLSMGNGYGFIDSESNLVCYDVISGSGGETRAIEVRVNYCNNPSDAWPIIAENKIAIKPKLIAKKEYATPSDYIGGWEAKVHSTWFEDENPLRAAMIVYLIMQEQNNDTTTNS